MLSEGPYRTGLYRKDHSSQDSQEGTPTKGYPGSLTPYWHSTSEGSPLAGRIESQYLGKQR